MYVIGLGDAVPTNRYLQRDCWEALRQARQFAQLTPRARAILKKVLLGSNGIETRYLALQSLREAFDLTPDTLHARFSQHAPALATRAAKHALAEAACGPEEIQAVIISTCTGYLCPGLTSPVAERLGLRPDVLALDLVGQGCGAAVPNLRTAEALLASGRCARVLSICVEVCSAAFYLDNDPGVLISACLFGDGAGAAVLAVEPPARGRPVQWRGAVSLLNPAQRESLRFEQKQGMLRNILTPQVPALAAEGASRVLEAMLKQAGLARQAIGTWILHTGGREVLRAVGERLGLIPPDLAWSGAVLRQYGNLSSASVLFTLRRALVGGASGGYWWLSSFGAGFSSHGALLCVG